MHCMRGAEVLGDFPDLCMENELGLLENLNPDHSFGVTF